MRSKERERAEADEGKIVLEWKLCVYCLDSSSKSRFAKTEPGS